MHSTIRNASLFACGLRLLVTSANLRAEDWPSWRGPTHEGSRGGADYPTKWSPDSVAWKVALPGKGASCPIVWKGKIYVTSPDQGIDTVLAFDLEGKELWKRALGKEGAPKHKKLGTSSNASPVTDGEGIYVYFKSGTLAALEMDGSVRWQRNLTEEFGAEKLYWDQGSSPTLVGDVLILPRLHGGDSWVGGFETKTGKLKWKQERNYEVPAENDNGYTTPVPFQHEGKDAVLIWCSDHLTAHSVEDGSVLWECGGFNPQSMKLWPHIATPVISGNMVVVPVGRDDRKQGSVHAVKLGGKGNVSESHHAWMRDDFGVFVASPVAYQEKVYLLRNKGGVVCLDPTSGEPSWEEEFPRSADSYYASPVVAGGVLYAARQDGVVFTAKVGDKFEFLGENPMGEQILATPVPFDGKVLLRGEKHLFCVE